MWRALLVLGLGACGNVDAPGANCPIGQLDCSGTCVDPLNNNLHCGACNAACDPGLVCGNGECALTCPLGQEVCEGSCVDPQTDADHCGACGSACAAGEECRAGVCERPCAESLVAPATADSWGLTWDGVARPALGLAQATIECEAFGGRLPTATEVYRASAQQSGDVGESFDTAPLWTAVPADDLDQVASRLSDGQASEVPANTPTAFRCVCAAPPPPFFTAERCNGDAGAPCVELADGRNLDREDRPALRQSSALWECQHELAHLADSTTLIAASSSGVVGSGQMLRTSDRWRYDLVTSVRWTGTTAWTPVYGLPPAGTHYFVDPTAPAPFRCVGPASAVGGHPNAVAGARVPAVTGLTLDDSDRAAPASWALAHDTCNAAGGHMATSAELAEGLYQGLDNGSGTNVWTADSCGYLDNANFLVATMRWSSRAARFPYVYMAGAMSPITWEYKHVNQSPFRCVYYPIDAEVAAPTTCNGGCFERTLGGATPAKLWFDTLDRAAANYGVAVADCADEGGALASERDLISGIRGGLPNGSNAYLWAADIGQGLAMIVKWMGVQTSFDDLYLGPNSSMTWDYTQNVRPYRCRWTNERR